MYARKDYAPILSKLYKFYRVFIGSKFKENLKAPHLKEISEELTNLYYGNISRICISLPPRHGKSSLITEAFPLWLIFQNPNLNIFIINNTQTLSEKFGIALREYVKEYGYLFDVYLSDVKHSNSHLMFTNSKGKLYNGSIRLQGTSGSITGQDCDVIVLDDIIKGNSDDLTPSALQKKIDWYHTIVEQRIEPHTKVAILMTRWHSNDLIGHLQEEFPEDYKFISCPAIKKDNTPLWSQRYTLEELKKKEKSIGSRMFQALYQQQPIDETSDFFPMDHIIWEETFEKYYKLSCRSWDIASSDNSLGNNRDYSVGVPMYKVSDNEYWITDFVHGQFGDETGHKVKVTAKLDGPSKPILLETGTKGGAAKLLYNEWKKQLKGYRTEQSEPIGTKPDRATPLKHAIYDGKIHVCINDNDLRELFIQQFNSFPNGKHDDIVDACAYAYNYLKDKQGNMAYSVGKQNYNKNKTYGKRRVRHYEY